VAGAGACEHATASSASTAGGHARQALPGSLTTPPTRLPTRAAAPLSAGSPTLSMRPPGDRCPPKNLIDLRRVAAGRGSAPRTLSPDYRTVALVDRGA